MVVKTELPRAPNGGLEFDVRDYYDPMDDKRPAFDIAQPTAEEVDEFHLAPVTDGYAGFKDSEIRRIDITCIGAGLGGITVAMLSQWRLKNVNLKIFEKNPRPSGTWTENKYPGCRCDLASHFYTWRFEPNPTWSAEYSGADEIEAYFTRIAKKYNLDAFTTYNAEVEALTWSEERQAWKIDLQTPEGPKSDWTHVVINSAGFINNVKDFKFEGEDLFKGKCMHTARFDRSVDVKGKKVAVIGNGSSGIQTIGTIGFDVAELHSYQRRNTYIIAQITASGERIDVHKYDDEEKRHFAQRKNAYEFYKANWRMMDAIWPVMVAGSPENEAAQQSALKLLEKMVPDPEVRKSLTPTYPIGCRRLTPHEHYLQVLQLPTTTIIRDEIERFTENGIVAGGVERECDIIIKAIGFDMNYIPRFEVIGRGGLRIADHWKEFPWTYKSMANAHFPNYVYLMGPNAGVASNSIHVFEEAQFNYIIQMIQRMQTHGEVAMEPKEDVEKAWHDDLQERLKVTVWKTCDGGGWYRHKSGNLVSHYPGHSLGYMDELKHPQFEDFVITKLSDMKDPSLNKIEDPVFGADVEKVAKIGPPRLPKIPEGNEELAAKIAAMTVN